MTTFEKSFICYTIFTCQGSPLTSKLPSQRYYPFPTKTYSLSIEKSFLNFQKHYIKTLHMLLSRSTLNSALEITSISC